LESIYHLILLGALLVALSIIAGMFSSRLGAPLLLVFLGLGMLAGEDGPGGIAFDDFPLTYLVGSVALAIILFDGGLRTPRAVFKVAMWPALSLATIGVVLTAVIVAAMMVWVTGVSWLRGLLAGSIVSSTDAAAVFLLLHLRGTELKKRVSATLEIESGLNDPMAIFLTVTCVELLLTPNPEMSWRFAAFFGWQMVGGALIGAVGGYLTLGLINRIEIAAGLYPILAAAMALIIFSGAQVIEASGFLAVYLAGLVIGNHRHRAQQVISRFHDGLAWLAQIVMFLLLGLLVTPSLLLNDLPSVLVIALGLIFIARPVAAWVSLLPFRFDWQERMFIAWVGLRGAVPIFLAAIPVIAGVADGIVFFNAAFVVVIASLIVQGWTVAPAARFLGLELPPPPEPAERREIDLSPTADREAASWRVAPNSPALDATFAELALPRRTRIIAVIRDGTVMNRQTLEKLTEDDYVIALAPPEHVITLDKLFSTRPLRRSRFASSELGEFTINADVTLGQLCSLYSLPFEPMDFDKTLTEFIEMRLGNNAVIGDRVKIGEVELVVRDFDRGKINKIGLELEPEAHRLPILRLWRRLIGRGEREG
jgi:cell volume regulation protein A